MYQYYKMLLIKWLFIYLSAFRGVWSHTSSNYVPIILAEKNGESLSQDGIIIYTPPGIINESHSIGSHPIQLARLNGATLQPEHIYINSLANSLEMKLKNIRNNELGITDIQELLDAMEFSKVNYDERIILNEIVDKLKRKLNSAIEHMYLLESYITEILPTSQLNDFYINTIIYPCLSPTSSVLQQPYDKQQVKILNYKNIVDQLSEPHKINFMFNDKLLKKIRSFNNTEVNHKRMYFLSKFDSGNDYTCNRNYADNLRMHRHLVSSIQNKRIVLLIDHGSTLHDDHLEPSKQLANNIINLLSDTDMISLVSISDKVNIYVDKGKQTFYGTMDEKNKLLNFIIGLNKTKEITNHTLGFEEIFQLLKNLTTNDNEWSMKNENLALSVIYVSRGLISSLSDALNVLKAIAMGQQFLIRPVNIDTCVVIIDERRVMYEKQFLHDIAMQNYSKFSIDPPFGKNSNVTGRMFEVNKNLPNKIINVATELIIYRHFQPQFLSGNKKFHLPEFDSTTNDLVVSITKPFKTFGMIGIDLHFNDLIEDFIYQDKFSNSYAFLMDLNGNTIIHPLYPRHLNESPYPTKIDLFENMKEFIAVIKPVMLENVDGIKTITLPASNGISLKLTYLWQRVLHYYVACLITFEKHFTGAFNLLNDVGGNKRMHKINFQNLSDDESFYDLNFHHKMSHQMKSPLMYHRLDLLSEPTFSMNVCQYFKRLGSIESGSLYLSPSAFKSPFIYFKNNYRNDNKCNQMHNVESIMAYIKDTSKLLVSPGLWPFIRGDVTALMHILNYLKSKHMDTSSLKKYVIRRYVATTTGVLEMFPGEMISNDLDPTRRSWFKKAIQNPGKIIISEPYLDVGGAGYIVTISHTLFEGKSNALHSPISDEPVAVVAIDITRNYFYKLLILSQPICEEKQIKCFLMDDKGYIISHQYVLEPYVDSPLSHLTGNIQRSHQHITQRESYVANDILNHRNFVKKKVCYNYINRTVQRYYQFNTSMADIITNSVNSERTKYQIKHVSGTNMFVGIINTTSGSGAFCPCSTIDRICLNCNRMEQTDCECPCECHLDMSLLSSTTSQGEKGIEPCDVSAEELFDLNEIVTASDEMDQDLKQCININCELYTSQSSCLGVIGCEWCQIDVDGESTFTVPFCTQQLSCFNGILGSMTPYGDGDLSTPKIDNSILPSYSTIGPVIGAIIALCLVVGFAMYCFKKNLDSSSENIYVESLADFPCDLPLSRFEYDEYQPRHDDGNGCNRISNNAKNSLLRSNEIGIEATPSPYRVAGNYRRPTNGGSDYGYSTMTPHEDSEHQCFIAESSSTKKRNSLSDSMSINTSISTPPNMNGSDGHSPRQTVPGMTIFSNDRHHRHHVHPNDELKGTNLAPPYILAPVTVHRQMETAS